MPRIPTWEQGVTAFLEKLDRKLDEKFNAANIEITDLKVKMAKLETQVKIYAAIAGAVGIAVGGAIAKLVIK